ncbi:hypothetical protein OPT61_g2709 [Boeremia exigua]|uniref:Uncharacterized protein n=1 Tax=Boeremia exigua TaxID=749465 RepID=A0ACC2IKR7_9PLEO|nr:hypothetical protein OPT61_g2709 [Boeremia exigua]
MSLFPVRGAASKYQQVSSEDSLVGVINYKAPTGIERGAAATSRQAHVNTKGDRHQRKDVPKLHIRACHPSGHWASTKLRSLHVNMDQVRKGHDFRQCCGVASRELYSSITTQPGSWVRDTDTRGLEDVVLCVGRACRTLKRAVIIAGGVGAWPHQVSVLPEGRPQGFGASYSATHHVSAQTPRYCNCQPSRSSKRIGCFIWNGSRWVLRASRDNVEIANATLELMFDVREDQPKVWELSLWKSNLMG